jgi:predicted O-methyltransferase YrrM
MITEPVFVENWFTDASCETLAGLVRKVKMVEGRVVELGSWEGRSTLAMAGATYRPIHAVDTWDGAPSDKYQREQVKTRDVFAQWCANLAEYRHQVTPYRMDWLAYAQLDLGPVALVFIDADHTYTEVCAQIDAFLPLMSPGGIICGDDYPMRPVWRAVRKRLRPGYQVEGRVWWWQA